MIHISLPEIIQQDGEPGRIGGNRSIGNLRTGSCVGRMRGHSIDGLDLIVSPCWKTGMKDGTSRGQSDSAMPSLSSLVCQYFRYYLRLIIKDLMVQEQTAEDIAASDMILMRSIR